MTGIAAARGRRGASGTSGLYQLAPRRLARQEVRPADIRIIKLPSPLGRASPALLAGASARRQDKGGEAEPRSRGWPAPPPGRAAPALLAGAAAGRRDRRGEADPRGGG